MGLYRNDNFGKCADFTKLISLFFTGSMRFCRKTLFDEFREYLVKIKVDVLKRYLKNV